MGTAANFSTKRSFFETRPRGSMVSVCLCVVFQGSRPRSATISRCRPYSVSLSHCPCTGGDRSWSQCWCTGRDRGRDHRRCPKGRVLRLLFAKERCARSANGVMTMRLAPAETQSGDAERRQLADWPSVSSIYGGCASWRSSGSCGPSLRRRYSRAWGSNDFALSSRCS